MKIAIIGTSNGVLCDGYASLFSNGQDKHFVKNFSLGGNCSIYASQLLAETRLQDDFDFCILDFFINDENYHGNGCLSVDQSLAYMYSALSKFRSSKCIPLVLALTNSNFAFNLDNSIIHKNQILLTKMLNVKTVNFAKYVQSTYQQSQIEEIYRDQAHYTLQFQQRIADCLAFAIAQLPRNHPKFPFNFFEINETYPANITFHNSETVDRKTSLISNTARRMTTDTVIHIDCAQWLCGITYWSDECTGQLTITNTLTTLEKNLRLIFHGLFIRNLLTPIKAKHLTIKIKDNYDAQATIDPTQHAVYVTTCPQNSTIDIVCFAFSNIHPSVFGHFLRKFIEVATIDKHHAALEHQVIDQDNRYLSMVYNYLVATSCLHDKNNNLSQHETIACLLARLTFLIIAHQNSLASDSLSSQQTTKLSLLIDMIFEKLNHCFSTLERDEHALSNDMLEPLNDMLADNIIHLQDYHNTKDATLSEIEYLTDIKNILKHEIINLAPHVLNNTPLNFKYFNETRYLENNPDVAAAVKTKAMPSGFAHWLLYGIDEKRKI